MKKKIFIITIIILILAVPAAILLGLFPLLQSPGAVNRLASYAQPMTGIYLHVDDIYLNRHLGGHISGLQIRDMKENGFIISLAKADIKGKASRLLNINIDTMVLTDLKATFALKKEKSQTNPFEILKKLPPFRLLEIRKGQLHFKSDSTVYSIPDMNLIVTNFNPEGSGHLKVKSSFNIISQETSAKGSLAAELDFAGFSPSPAASGSFRIICDKSSFSNIKIDNATFSSGFKLNGDIISLEGAGLTANNIAQKEGKGKFAVKNIEARFNASYNQKTSAISLTSLEFSGADTGWLKGHVSISANPLAWDASLKASSLDIARTFGMIKPLLPDNYREWTFKGKSGFDIDSIGRSENDTLIWNTKGTLELHEGGFASPDSSNAAEKINSKIKFKFDAPEKNCKGNFDFDIECAGGEFLWGTYYQDFKGRKARISATGTFAQKPFLLSFSGRADLFQTGDYRFSFDSSNDRNLFSLTAGNISLNKLYNTVAQNYVSQNYPGVKDLKIEGESDLHLTLMLSGQQKAISGNLAIRGGALHSSSNKLTLTGLNISLPYDLVLSGNSYDASSGNRNGTIAFDLLEKDNFRISKYAAPVVFSGNRFILPDAITVKTSGGEINIAGLKAENLLRPEVRVETGMNIKRVDLEKLIGKEAPVSLSGIIEGNLSPIIFQNGRWNAGGALTAKLFGGQIKIENIFAGKLFSASQFLGADASFNNMDLEKLTSSIKVGRMTGLIKGSLKNLSIEYGQPSSFDLVITTDTSRNVPKLISVDAINDLSIISTGSGAISDILSSGLNQFFKDYPYSQIGIRCTLKDDIFKLRGLIREGNKEYLVKKSLFRGVDIINQNPDNYISFKDMAERVGRINKSQKETKNVP